MSKVLIIASSFNSGDAITMINLFSKWEKSELFLATPTRTPYIDSFSCCYYLGNKEQHVPLIFKPFVEVGKSEVFEGCESKKKLSCKSRNSLVYRLYKKYFLCVLQIFGFYDKRISISVSRDFKTWVDKIEPDIIYSPVSNSIILKFLLQCQKAFPHSKFIFHGFDDWIEPSYRVMFRRRYVRHVDSLYRCLISNSSLLLSTTKMMSEEYAKRYHKNFITFYNPVNLSINGELGTKKFSDNYIHITYIGKIAWHNAKAIANMQKAVSIYNREQSAHLVLDVFSQTGVEDMRYFKICQDENMRIHSAIPNNEIVSLLRGSNILFLPITVSKEVAAFTKFSMSTKMGEYLSSGVPIIYCGPDSIAMTNFIKENRVALFTSQDGEQALYDLLKECLNNVELMNETIKRGLELSQKLFDRDVVSNNFYRVLNSVVSL